MTLIVTANSAAIRAAINTSYHHPHRKQSESGNYMSIPYHAGYQHSHNHHLYDPVSLDIPIGVLGIAMFLISIVMIFL